MKCTKCNKEFVRSEKDRRRQCRKCITKRLIATGYKRYLSRKIELIKSLGGGCQHCKYNTNITSLVFHHKDPKEKSFEINGWAFRNKPVKVLLAESKKCLLLCHNCHFELHYPEKNHLL